MKSKINRLLIASFLCCITFLGCSGKQSLVETEAVGENPCGVLLPKGKLKRMGEGLVSLSWTVKDDVILKGQTVENLVITILLKEGLISDFFLSKQPLEFTITEDVLRSADARKPNYNIVEDGIISRKNMIDEKVILKPEAIEKAKLHWVAEDIVIFAISGSFSTILFDSYL